MLLTDSEADIARTCILNITKFNLCATEQPVQKCTVKFLQFCIIRKYFYPFYLLTPFACLSFPIPTTSDTTICSIYKLAFCLFAFSVDSTYEWLYIIWFLLSDLTDLAWCHWDPAMLLQMTRWFILWMNIFISLTFSVFIHLSVYNLGCFYILAIVNNAAVNNTCICLFKLVFFPLDKQPEV